MVIRLVNSVVLEPIVSSETSAVRTQTPGNYPKRNKLHLEHSESLKQDWYLKFFCPVHSLWHQTPF